MKKDELEALLARVEAATGPDRELDTDIGDAMNVSVLPEYTSSIDAAVALAKRVKTDANCFGYDETPKYCTGYVSRNYVSDGSQWLYEGEAKTPPLTILAALLRALISEAK